MGNDENDTSFNDALERQRKADYDLKAGKRNPLTEDNETPATPADNPMRGLPPDHPITDVLPDEHEQYDEGEIESSGARDHDPNAGEDQKRAHPSM